MTLLARPRLTRLDALLLAGLGIWALVAAFQGRWLLVVGCAAGAALLWAIPERSLNRTARERSSRRRRVAWAVVAVLTLLAALALWFYELRPAVVAIAISGLILAEPRRDGRWVLTPNDKTRRFGFAVAVTGTALWLLDLALVSWPGP